MKYSNKTDQNKPNEVAQTQQQYAVITGDIVNSSQIDKSEWKPIMQRISYKHKAEIYRGDSFQLRCPTIHESVFQALQIKASVKTCRNLDVRMSIGIGSEEYREDSVGESGGMAYERSGKSLDRLVDNRDGLLKLTSADEDFNREMNTILELISVITSRWKPSQARAVNQLLIHGRNKLAKVSQKSLAEQLNLKPNTISIQLAQANKRSIMRAETLLHDKLLAKFGQ